MAIFRSFSEIVNSIIERLRLTQPNMDTKPGTVSRDLFIDIPADQLERLHSSLLLVSEKQSPEIATGRDLDRWASNFGITRKSGSPSNGIVVFTANDISTDIPIPAGTVVVSRNGLSFKTIGNYILSVSEKNRFSATANRLRSALNLAGISDSFAIEVPVKATGAGTTGNLSSFQINEHTLPDALKVINLSSFNGGSNIESDAAFRSRVFAIFSGSNTGTAFGYRNAALSIAGVNDAIVIEPGNTLMLRDGTETIQINDGTFRVLNSGTGGKVDLYILGRKLEEIVESYIFVNKSGSSDIADERNDFIMGQGNLDFTLTSSERRVKAFSTGVLPQQPVSSIISVIGNVSGVLSEQVINEDGTSTGNYILLKDNNLDTGGSPFCFDKLRFVSANKEVEAETIIKKSNNSVDALRFVGATELEDVYQDISILSENSKVSSVDKKIIKLNHYPVLTVSKVLNKTTGEIYVIESQQINSKTGLNDLGEIIISGRTLPSSADVLSVNYVWRLFYDKYIDYNGKFTGSQFLDPSVNDSIDWGISNGIKAEISTVDRTVDGLEYQIQVKNNISRIVSVYSAEIVNGTIQNVENIDGSLVPGIILEEDSNIIDNIISVVNESGVEIFKTIKNDGLFSARSIILPTDSAPGDSVIATVFYNKTEIFNIEDGDGAFSNNFIILPSEDILEANEISDIVENINLTQEEIYIDYVADIVDLVPSQSLTSLPINGSDNGNELLNSSLGLITGSNQPIFYQFSDDGQITNIEKFGPTRIATTISNSNRPGKIKISGQTLTRITINVLAGISISGLTFNLNSVLKSYLNVSNIPSNIGIARIDDIIAKNKTFDLIGQKLQTNFYSFGIVDVNTQLKNFEFTLPSTTNNNSLSFSSGEELAIDLLLYNINDSEDLYFPANSKIITNKIFSKIDLVSVSSGFRTPAGSLVGSVSLSPFNQPGTGLSYFSNYKFLAPTEGERITVRYNLNRLISDVTANLETVRSITADVLVKEVPLLEVSVEGQIIVNEELLADKNSITENVSNAISNLLNSSTLGSTIDYSDLINVATSISGVDSVNISKFNENNKNGRRSFIKALDNQSIVAGEVIFTSVSRKDFRIT